MAVERVMEKRNVHTKGVKQSEYRMTNLPLVLRTIGPMPHPE